MLHTLKIVFIFTLIIGFAVSLSAQDSLAIGRLNSISNVDTILKEVRNYFYKEDYKTALAYIEKGLELSRKTNNREGIGHLVGIEAYIYLNQGLPQKSMEKFSQVLQIGKLLGDSLMISSSLHGKGRSFIELGLYNEAIEELRLGLGKYVDSNDKHRISIYNNSIAMAYSKLGLPEKALFHYNEFRKSAIELKDSVLIVYSLVNIGEIYNDMKNYDLALTYMRDASSLNAIVNDPQAKAAIAGNLGRYYFNLNKIDSSYIMVKKAIKYCYEYNNARFQPDNYRQLIKIYQKRNQLDSALYANEKLLSYMDSVFAEDKINTMLYMNSYFEMEEKMHKAELMTQQLKTRTYLLWFSLAFIVLFVMLLILLYSRYKLKMRLHLREKSQLNLTIDEKNRELVGKVLNQSQTSDLSFSIIGSIDKALENDNVEKTRELLSEIKSSLSKKKPGTFNWENFKIHFEQVHPQFFDKLKKINNDLTINDLRHCAYIRMNLNTKEIAGLMNISDRSVQTARYRIKKKLELAAEIDLTTHLHNI